MGLYERRSKDGGGIRKRGDISGCRRHPKHQQEPGVCSLCLHEKLSKICSGTSSRSSSSSYSSMQHYDYNSSGSSSSSRSSSSGSSTAASPVRFDRNAVLVMKSRSIAFAPRRKRREVNNNGSVKLGFWSKLISRRPAIRGIIKTMLRER